MVNSCSLGSLRIPSPLPRAAWQAGKGSVKIIFNLSRGEGDRAGPGKGKPGERTLWRPAEPLPRLWPQRVCLHLPLGHRANKQMGWPPLRGEVMSSRTTVMPPRSP